MKKIFYFIWLCGLLILPVKAQVNIGDTIRGKVWVIDGDSLRITDSRYRKYEVRIFGIDAPELSSNAGQYAKRFLIGVIKSVGRTATCKVVDRDRYRRYVSICKTSAGDLAEIMLKNKQARLLTRYFHLVPKYIQSRYKKAYRNRR